METVKITCYTRALKRYQSVDDNTLIGNLSAVSAILYTIAFEWLCALSPSSSDKDMRDTLEACIDDDESC
jgi:hypothetical protein